MRSHRPQVLAGSPTKSLLVLSLLVCLLLAACSGSAGSDAPAGDSPANEEVAQAPTNTPAAAAQEDPTEVPTEIPSEAPAENAPASTPTTSPTEAPAQEAAASKIFQIDPAQSEARFIVNEVLFGNPNEVVGSTTEVTGQIEIDLNDPTQTKIGEIQINARSLATDNRFRNRSVNRLILQSNRDEYQFITFTPTAIEGLPAEANVGDTLTLQITGDLKIRDIVQPVTFEATVTADSENQISGLAQATVQRADFELTIPQVKGVADVTEEVRLELQFVAVASE
jgi:polyisoprenoid-binding protein YceI